jgi:hypothetical protein
MRDEMLKRLDELVQSVYTTPAEWLAFRAELAAERCENCTHWRFADVGSSALCMKPGAYLYQFSTVYHYCCIHFETKK